MRHVLVTGGAGFVGSNLIKTLLGQKGVDRITSLDDYSSGSHANHHDGVTYVHGHTADIEQLLCDLTPDTIFHFGEFSRIVPSFDDPDRTFSANLTGTFRVILYAIRRDAKLIYSGSSSIFGNDMEDQHLNPYSWCKAKNIELIRNAAQWFRLRFAICYFFNVFGPGQISTGPYATVIGIFERQFAANEPLTVVRPGTQTRAFTHIDDIVQGILLVADKGEGDRYFLGTDENTSILEIVGMFGSEHVFVSERRGERLQSIIHESRARTELGWSPVHTLSNYIREHVQRAQHGE